MSGYFKDKTVVTFLAHPDDEALGCGGTLSRAIREGAKVHCIIPVKRLEDSCLKVMDELGVSSLHWGGFDDNQMDKYPLLEVCKFASKYIAELNPDILITHHYSCSNQDHQVCYKASSIITKPVYGKTELWTCEVASSTGYLRPCGFEPNLYVGLDQTDIDIKKHLVGLYASELRSDRSPDILENMARVRGAESGNQYAEGFMVVRSYV